MAELVEEALVKALTRSRERPRVGWYYPSLLPSCLLRQFWIYREGFTVSLEKSGLFKIGELLHGFLAEALRGQTEVEAEKPLLILLRHGGGWIRLSGRVDLIIQTGEGRWLVEVKSIARLPSKPLEHHVLQVQPYMLALDLEDALLVYLEKRRLGWRVFKVRYEQELMDRLLERARRLHRSLLNGEAPNPEPGWMCRYCEFMDRCGAKR